MTTASPGMLALIDPLSPFQMMDFCTAVQEAGDQDPSRWSQVARHVNDRHPGIEPISADQTASIYHGLVAAYPEIPALMGSNSKVAPARALFLRLFYELVSTANTDADMGFLNLGYARLDGSPMLELDPRDEPNRFSIQLYTHLFAGAGLPALDFHDKDVIEVGCGRGGGCEFIARTMDPRSVTGFDITRSSLDYCRQAHQHPRLSYRFGSAVDLPLHEGCCDIVVNIESSHCYPSTTDFLAEVHRVLRPGGVFLFTDIRHATRLHRGYERIDTLHQQIDASPLQVLERREVTPNVMRALELDGAQLISRWRGAVEGQPGLSDPAVGYVNRHFMRAGSTTQDQTWYGAFDRGEYVYWSFVMRKP